MHSLSERYRRTMPERTVDVREVADGLAVLLEERFGKGAELAVRVYDERERFMEEQRRQVQQHAAALAQRYLVIAHELMRAAGNGVWNSPVGFDRVLMDIMEAVQREAGEALRSGGELNAHAVDYSRLLAEQVSDNVARRDKAGG